MNDKTRRMMIVWFGLSEAERSELEEEIRRNRSKGAVEQEELRKQLNRVATGPLSGTCPYCGR